VLRARAVAGSGRSVALRRGTPQADWSFEREAAGIGRGTTGSNFQEARVEFSLDRAQPALVGFRQARGGPGPSEQLGSLRGEARQLAFHPSPVGQCITHDYLHFALTTSVAGGRGLARSTSCVAMMPCPPRFVASGPHASA
jgi:hypothetical protein